MQSISANGMLNAYRAAAGLAAEPTDMPAGRQPRAGSAGFGALLGEAIQQAAGQERAAATASIEGLAGRASTVDVVVALSRAELAVQTAVAVRDRVVAAYQEVMRMPI